MVPKINRRALGRVVSPPFAWDDNDSSHYSLEEIADEFMMWDIVATWDEDVRRQFLYDAFEQSFPDEAPAVLSDRFLCAYESLYQQKVSIPAFGGQIASPGD